MKLFMLGVHDATKRDIRDLAAGEIDAIFGGGGQGGSDDSPFGGPDCGDSTTCDTTVITPGADAQPAVDCDAG
mgnify:CR=1 FL=1